MIRVAQPPSAGAGSTSDVRTAEDGCATAKDQSPALPPTIRAARPNRPNVRQARLMQCRCPIPFRRTGGGTDSISRTSVPPSVAAQEDGALVPAWTSTRPSATATAPEKRPQESVRHFLCLLDHLHRLLDPDRTRPLFGRVCAEPMILIYCTGIAAVAVATATA